jgi:hypothetical protein
MRTYKTPLFEKRHYEWMAETLRGMRKYYTDMEYTTIVNNWSLALCHSNPNYNRTHFVDARHKEVRSSADRHQ